jgi:hypothetical protein
VCRLGDASGQYLGAPPNFSDEVSGFQQTRSIDISDNELSTRFRDGKGARTANAGSGTCNDVSPPG